MATTRRSSRTSAGGQQASKAANQRRTAFGDVSNRRKTRSASAKGRATKKKSDEPVAASDTNRATEEEPVNDNEVPKRRRSLRSCVIAQGVKSDQSTRSSKEKKKSNSQSKRTTRSKSTGRAKKAPSQAAAKPRGRSAKRSRDEPEDTQRETKRAKRSTSTKRKPAPKKKSASVKKKPRGRSKSTSRAKGRTSRRASKQPELCSSFVKETDYSMVREPFDESKFTLGIAPHDAARKDDVLEVSNYTTDIFQRLYQAEATYRPDLYMEQQEEITPTMRAILVDWLVEVHMKFRLAPATLYLCVTIIDRFCSKAPVSRRKLQLVGVTALLVACKYEEIYPPEVRDCVYITDRTYSRQDVLDMEQDIMRHLEFRMTVPTAYPFLVRFLLITKASELTKIAANYYMERSLQEYEFLHYRPSLVAASAVCLALNNTDIRGEDGTNEPPPGIPRILLDYTRFSADEIKECAAIIVEKVSETGDSVPSNRRNLVAVKNKFDNRKYQHISTEFEEPDMENLRDM